MGECLLYIQTKSTFKLIITDIFRHTFILFIILSILKCEKFLVIIRRKRNEAYFCLCLLKIIQNIESTFTLVILTFKLYELWSKYYVFEILHFTASNYTNSVFLDEDKWEYVNLRNFVTNIQKSKRIILYYNRYKSNFFTMYN